MQSFNFLQKGTDIQNLLLIPVCNLEFVNCFSFCCFPTGLFLVHSESHP